MSLDQFSEHLLAPLLQLASDPVPNVRVLLAKTLRQSLMERGQCQPIDLFLKGVCVYVRT